MTTYGGSKAGHAIKSGGWGVDESVLVYFAVRSRLVCKPRCSGIMGHKQSHVTEHMERSKGGANRDLVHAFFTSIEYCQNVLFTVQNISCVSSFCLRVS